MYVYEFQTSKLVYDCVHETIKYVRLCRYATTWMYDNGTLARQLIKAYGIRIDILVTGQVCINILR